MKRNRVPASRWHRPLLMSRRLTLAIMLGLGLLASCSRPTPPTVAAVSSEQTLEPAAPISIAPTDWPWWRGVESTATTTAGDPPTEWAEDRNVLWKTPVPGRGYASPIVVGERVFIATADDDSQTQSLLAFDLSSGKPLWERELHRGELPKLHKKNSHASATPASDGQRVYAAFVNHDALYVSAVDFEGHTAWTTKAGPFQSEHGFGSSPVLHESLVIVSGDSQGVGYLAALHRETGGIVWLQPRDASRENGSYATPVVAHLSGRDQLVHAGFDKVTSTDPATGEVLWWAAGPARVMANSVAAQDPYVVVSGGYPDQAILCIRTDGSGDVTDSHIAWSSKKHVAYVPSPFLYDDSALILTGEGIFANFNLETGEMRWQKRVGGNFSASITRVGDLHFAPNEDGLVTVFRLNPEFEKVAANSLGDAGGMASITPAADKLLIRTRHSLYAIGAQR